MVGLLLHSLHNVSMADRRIENGRDSKVDSNINLQQSKDTDNSWSFVNLHHSATFNRTSLYYGGFTFVMIIIGTLVFLFCCGGMKRCLSHFNTTSHNSQSIANMLLQSAGSMIPMHLLPKQTPFTPPYNPQNLQPTHFGGQTVGYPQICTNILQVSTHNITKYKI